MFDSIQLYKSSVLLNVCLHSEVATECVHACICLSLLPYFIFFYFDLRRACVNSRIKWKDRKLRCETRGWLVKVKANVTTLTLTCLSTSSWLQEQTETKDIIVIVATLKKLLTELSKHKYDNVSYFLNTFICRCALEPVIMWCTEDANHPGCLGRSDQ